ncbi:MAG: kelch repeat-containing protein, partial [Verrucomicrobiota bacterium]
MKLILQRLGRIWSRSFFVAVTIITGGVALTAGEKDHAIDDEFWAEAMRMANIQPVEYRAKVVNAADRKRLGTWSGKIDWPHIPVSAFNMPNGKIATFASNRRDSFPRGAEFTYAAVYDPATGKITERNHDSHDMFCATLVMMEDGRPLVLGGRNTVRFTSVFDWKTEKWKRTADMNDGRWYATATHLSGNNVAVASGSGGTNTVELGSPSGFRRLSGINWSGIAGASGFESHWWPINFLAPNGRIFHAGPTDRMHWVNPNGSGQLIDSGKNVPGNWYPKHSATAMYAKGKIIVAGGAANTGGGTTNAVYTVDVNGNTPVVQQKASMKHRRRFASGVMLPDGNFMAVGGNTSGKKFNDEGTVYECELYNPNTNKWSVLADLAIPRNYHSVALLLADGRVYAGGGGLNGTSPSNHPDAQVYSPYYLYNSSGGKVGRPKITGALTNLYHYLTFKSLESPSGQKNAI